VVAFAFALRPEKTVPPPSEELLVGVAEQPELVGAPDV
jgi:hypothetical protein